MNCNVSNGFILRQDLEDFGDLVPDMRSAKSAHKKIQGLTKVFFFFFVFRIPSFSVADFLLQRAKRKGAYGGDDF